MQQRAEEKVNGLGRESVKKTTALRWCSAASATLDCRGRWECDHNGTDLEFWGRSWSVATHSGTWDGGLADVVIQVRLRCCRTGSGRWLGA